MLTIRVEKNGTGDFRTVAEALQSVPYALPALIVIGEGVFEEKLFSDHRDIRLEGSGPGRTVLRWADGAKHPHADGTLTGTFRSYTLFLGGGRASLARLTVENAAGDGERHGQGLAVYADAERVFMEEVRLLGCQDTLFCAPLPQKERLPRGFLGPRALTPRVPSRQQYRRCEIHGDVDFIFGGADALFEDCTLVSRDRGEAVNGYVVAPSGGADGAGFLFAGCRFVSAAPAGTVYLGRPWRETGRAVLLGCTLGAHIRPEGWSAWEPRQREPRAFFAEYRSAGPGANPDARVEWSHELTEREAADWYARAEAIRRDAAGIDPPTSA